jgi:signal peptidase I
MKRLMLLLLLIIFPLSSCVSNYRPINPPIVYCNPAQIELLACTESFKVKGLVFHCIGYGSMLPIIKTDDYLIVMPKTFSENDLLGKIVAYKSNNVAVAVTHRLVRKYKEGYVAKGDNNLAADIEYVTQQNIIGEVIEIFRAKK